MTAQEFEDGLNNILESVEPRGVNGSPGITKAVFKIIGSLFSDAFAEVQESALYQSYTQGPYNVATNSPTLTGTPSNLINNGSYFDVTVGGNIGFGGLNFSSGASLKSGDRLCKLGNSWYLITSPANTARIETWTETSYVAGAQVNLNGIDYVALQGTVSADVPGVSSKWIERLAVLNLLASDRQKVIDFNAISGRPTVPIVSYPTISNFSYVNGLVSATVTVLLYSNFISALEVNNVVFQNNRQWVCIGMSGTNVIIVSTRTSLIGQLRTISSSGALSATISTPFPTTAIPSNATRIRVDVSGDNVVISHSVDGLAFTVWGSVSKSALGLSYTAKRPGFMAASSDNAFTNIIYDVEPIGWSKFRLNAGSIDETSNLTGKHLLVGSPTVEKGVEKFSANDILTTRNSQGFKRLFQNNVQPALSMVSSPSSNAFTFNNNIITITPTSGNCAIATAAETDVIVMSTPPTLWLVIGFNAVTGEHLLLRIGSSLIGQIRGLNSVGTLSATYSSVFPATAIPLSTRIKIDVSTNNIIVSWSADGVKFTVWASVPKDSIGTGYTNKRLGYLVQSANGQVSNTIFSYENEGFKDFEMFGDGVPTISDLADAFLLFSYPNLDGMAKAPASAYLSPNRFAGGSAALYGDSITAQGGVNYSTLVRDKLSLSSVNVHGFSGHAIGNKSGIAGTLADATKLNAIISQGPSVVIIMAGTNDFGLSVAVGTEDSSVVTETCGGLNFIIETLQTALPNCRIVVCTPTPRFFSGSTQTTPNGVGLLLRDYVNAIKNVCSRRSIPVLDLYASFGVNAFNHTIFFNDGLHFLTGTYNRLTDMQAAFIKSL